MKGNILLKSILIIVCLSALLVSSIYFLLLPKTVGDTTVDVSEKLFGWKFPSAQFPVSGTVEDSAAYSHIRNAGGIPRGLPVRLKIPVIGVESAIEDAYITNEGRMDVPAGSVNVAWFSLGVKPGQKGSAVIGGHFGINNGVKFVFYDLDKLNVGDKVYIEDDKGNTLAFQVKVIKLFGRNADATTVFTSGDGRAHLNLITCEGVWNQVNDTYPDRRVVFTDAIPSEGPVVINKVTPIPAVIPIEIATSPINGIVQFLLSIFKQ